MNSVQNIFSIFGSRGVLECNIFEIDGFLDLKLGDTLVMILDFRDSINDVKYGLADDPCLDDCLNVGS